jgi:hypothetical protein
LKGEAQSHSLPATNLVGQISADEGAGDIEAVNHHSPSETLDQRVVRVDARGDGAREDSERDAYVVVC